jgi:hypothetical protein
MTPERLFSLLNLIAMVAWLPLVVFPRKRWATDVGPIAVPLVLAMVYVAVDRSRRTRPRRSRSNR